ncbi:MAG: IS3 family transposase [Treponema sp.]|nr:IS3 family transposase [Treponema sp.]
MIVKGEPGVKFAIIQEMTSRDNNLLNISWLCKIAGVSRAGYYKWLNAQDKRQAREKQDEEDFALILVAFQYRGYAKGARGIHMRLLHIGVVMNVKKIRRLMKKYNLLCPIQKANPYRQLHKQMQEAKIAPNILNREFRLHGARSVLLTDITYIPRRERGKSSTLKFSYLCVIMDAFTKEILAWSMSSTPDSELVKEALLQLMEKYGGELKTKALLHSDQGCQYTSYLIADVISNTDLQRSMSRKACCWDNAPQESLFGHMKDEVHFAPSDHHYRIVRKVTDWIDYYNNDRYQWGLAKLSPREFCQYVITGKYPLPIGAPPQTPEFIALVSGEGAGEEKDDTN